MITGKIIIQKGETCQYAAIVDQVYVELEGMLLNSDNTEARMCSNDSDIINASVKYEIIFKRTE